MLLTESEIFSKDNKSLLLQTNFKKLIKSFIDFKILSFLNFLFSNIKIKSI